MAKTPKNHGKEWTSADKNQFKSTGKRKYSNWAYCT